MRKVCIILSFCLLSLSGFAQTILENNSPKIKWSQINTPHFRVLFPTGDDTEAQRVANTLEAIHGPEAATLGNTPPKISIILQSHSSVSNAFVSVSPRRSEFYVMPSQNYNFTGNTDWLDLISSHEYRHVVQFEHAKTGFNKFVYTLFGNNTFSGLAHAAAPDWFWEGDAVAIETAYTPTGRGKIPNFGLVFKTNLLEGREFNYHKQYLRSYKHFIPNHYVLGYYMVSYMRRKTNDPEIWGKITANAWKWSFVPFTFSNSIHKETGLYVVDYYKEMASELKKEWQAEIDRLKLTDFERVNNRTKKAYTDYEFPQPFEDGILVLKSGIGDIQQFVLLKNGKETRIFTPGMVNESGMLSAVKSKVVWNEFGYDPRWRATNYSLIKSYDESSKTRTMNTDKHSRYAGAALSPDGEQIVTVRTDVNYKTMVVVIDFSSGRVLHAYPNPENEYYSMARFSPDGKKIVALKMNRKQKSVVLIDVQSGNEEIILPYSDENIGYPVLVDDYLLYNSPYTGIDNIFAVQLSTKEKFQVTTSKYGAYNPAVDAAGTTLYYNDQTKNGLDVVKIPFTPGLWKPIAEKSAGPNLYQHLIDQEKGSEQLFSTIPATQHPVTKYSRFRSVINPYSWGTFFSDDLTTASIGISSKDILSTTAIDLGYYFDINERTGYWQAGVSYQGWYPIIDVQYRTGNRNVDEGDIRYRKVVGTDTTTVVENLTFDWKENTVEAGIRIPLLTTQSKYQGSFEISNYVGYTTVADFENSIDSTGRVVPSNYPQYFFRNYQDHGHLVYNRFNINAYRLLKRSTRDINSKWGQTMSMTVYNTPYGGDFSGLQFSVFGRLFFPGFFKHHSFYGYGAYQFTQIDDVTRETVLESDNYTFRNQIPLPRGQSVGRFKKFYSVSANYALPLWYPDIAMGPILNIQRVRANFFFDYGFGSSQTQNALTKQTYTSVGTEVKFDINIFRFRPQLDVGFRYSIGLQPSTTQFEFLLGTFNF